MYKPIYIALIIAAFALALVAYLASCQRNPQRGIRPMYQQPKY